MSIIRCPHNDRVVGGRVCAHLLDEKDASYAQRFTGIGLNYDLICCKCHKEAEKSDVALASVCVECFQAIATNGSWEGIAGKPEVPMRECDLRFEHEDIELPELAAVCIVDVQPIEAAAGRWLACTSTGTLIEIAPAQYSCRAVAQVPQDALEFDQGEHRETKQAWLKGPTLVMRVSRNGDLVAIANGYGQSGVVMDLATGKPAMRMRRDKYHEDVSCFPLAFVETGDRTMLIHATAWNRLDVSDARTGTLLTERGPTSYQRGEARPEHYLDYFHSSLLVSPDQQLVTDNGWVWHPSGVVVTWNLPQWLHENVWESEDGMSKRSLCWRAYYWDGPLCWIDNQRLAVWGYGQDDEWLIPAVCIFDAHSGRQVRWFAGPKGSMVFDDYLFSFDRGEGTSVWDIETGEKLLSEPGFCPSGYHRSTKQFLSLLDGGTIRVSSLVGGK